VELMDGAIGVEGAAGAGSTFWFTAQLRKAPQSTAQTVPNLDACRVLVVDDNSTNRRILEEQLSAWHMTVSSAVDGAQALERLRTAATEKEPFQLAILDMQMPGMDGLQLARLVKEDPATAATRLVLLTSLGGPELGPEAQAAGLVAALTKPVRPSYLLDTVMHALANPAGSVAKGPGLPSYSQDAGGEVVAPPTPRLVRILLAEDNPVNQQVARRMLEKLGFQADVVADGREAVQAMAQVPYDLVLMDVQMPTVDGFEATAEIRRREAGSGRHTPIIAMTANALQGDRDRCLTAGMDDYVPKPVRLDHLAAVLARWERREGAVAADPATQSVGSEPR
jgi:CheY-like chemotaxis protein